MAFKDHQLFDFDQFTKNYQGNVRVVADTGGNILQRVNYYPYGAPWNDDIPTAGYQAHKYGGKELDLMHGLNLYDFGAREYDPALGLFTGMDPLCEKYYHISPYAYCAGNPVRYRDLFGDSIFVQSHQGTFYHYDMDNRTFLDANGMGYGKDEPFIDNVSNALNALSLKPTGFDLVHNLAVDKKGVLISPTSPIRIRKVSEKKGNVNGEQAYIEFGLTSGIIWDPNSSNMGGAPFISLAHELAHSWDRIQHGFVSERRWGKTGIKGDIYATHIENKIRAENGYPLRAFYGIYEGRLVDPIIDSSGRSLYYDSLENRSKRILKEGGYIYMFAKKSLFISLFALLVFVPIQAQKSVKANDLHGLITSILQQNRKKYRYISSGEIKMLNKVRMKSIDNVISNMMIQSDTIWYMTYWNLSGGRGEEIFNAEYIFESGFYFDNIYAIDAFTDCFKHEGRLTSDERMVRSWDKEWIEKVKEHHVNDGYEIFAVMIIREKEGKYRYYSESFTNYNEFLLCFSPQYKESEEYLRYERRKYKKKRCVIIR